MGVCQHGLFGIAVIGTIGCRAYWGKLRFNDGGGRVTSINAILTADNLINTQGEPPIILRQ